MVVDFEELFRFYYFLEAKRSLPPSNNLLPYIALPKTEVNNYNFDSCMRSLKERRSFNQVGALGFAPQDTGVFKLRFNFLAGNDAAFRISTKKDPTAEDLEELGYSKPCWSILYPIKQYLWDHRQVANKYRGYLPFGSEVIKFLCSSGFIVEGTPSVLDHMNLRDASNRMADALNVPSITINDLMYIDGSKR